jgi:virginiamycin B lyase
MSRVVCYCIAFAMIVVSFLPNQWLWAQLPGSPDEFVTYEKQSGFIKEFAVPFEELGLRGITIDPQGNVWSYHSTNRTSTLVYFNSTNGEFTKFPVKGETVTDNPIINLASTQLAFDSKRNAVWFTDARTNSIGKLDVASGQVNLFQIPTDSAGPMGIILSPDGNGVWFTEITGNKIASIDAESMRITEYSTGEDSGPALLTFDDSGILWVTLSFSNSVLRVDPRALSSSNNPSSAMTELKLSGGEDTFSPFGIAVSDGKVYVSDHGSSRVIVSDAGFVNYISYWTSPSMAFPTTLPSQVVADMQGNIYFPQHGGNRISVIDTTGVMTEYEIPTGPLATAVFIAASADGKVWFTEWASNKIAYLDTAIQVPFTLNVGKAAVILDRSGPQSISVFLNGSEDTASPVSLSEIEIGLTGMTESGLKGITYEAQPPRVNLQDAKSAESEIQIRAKENARPGSYTAMIRALAPEQDGLVISKLYPVELVLDVPEPASSQGDNMFQNEQTADTTVQDVLRIGAPLGAAGVAAFAIYRWKKARRLEKAH